MWLNAFTKNEGERNMRQHNLYITECVYNAISRNTLFELDVREALNKFRRDDWGDLCESDKELNRIAKCEGGRIFAAYKTCEGRLYIITDNAKACPASTTILFAYEH